MKRVEKVASEILSELNISIPPVPIEKIAESLNIKVKYEVLGENVSGVIFRKNNSVVIGISAFDPPVRQRFTIAHELGHFLLHGVKKDEFLFIENSRHYRDNHSSEGIYKKEIEANSFAASLLMPEDMVRNEFYKFNDISPTDLTKKMAKKFNVSEVAMSIRLENLKLLYAY